MTRPVRRYWGSPWSGVVRPVRVEPARVAVRELWWRVALLAACGLAVVQSWRFFTTSPGFAVRRVDVRGASRADTAGLVAASGLVGQNVFRADLETAREAALRLPWIADAALHRSLPDAVRIDVREKEAFGVVADGASLLVLDADGRTIVEAERGTFALPEIIVPRGDERARVIAARTLAAIRDRAPDLYARVETVDATVRGRIVVRAAGQPALLVAGPESVDEVVGWLERAAGVFQALGDVEHVDARWRDRLFVLPRG